MKADYDKQNKYNKTVTNSEMKKRTLTNKIYINNKKSWPKFIGLWIRLQNVC